MVAQFSLFLVFACLICTSAGAGVKSPLILILTDGFSWKLFEDQTIKIPNLRSLANNGAYAKYMKNSYPTSTWPNMHTIMTGLYPESHGIVSNLFWDPVYKEMFVYDYESNKFWNSSRPFWLENQVNGGRSGVYFWPSFSSYQPIMPDFYENVYCDANCSVPGTKGYCTDNCSEPFVSRIDKIITWFKQKNPPNFVALYIDEPDRKGHKYGPNSQEYKTAVELVDSSIGHFISRLKEINYYDNTNIIIVSDHGFAEVPKENTIFLDNYIDANDYMSVEKGPYVQIWPNPGKIEELYSKLKNKHPRMNVYKKDEIPEELHWKNNRRIPPLFALADEGWVILPGSTLNYTVSSTTGYHGYSLSYKNMWAIFLAHGPDFKKGFKVENIHNVDIYPLMSHLLELEPHPNNGSLGRVRCMLTDNNCPVSGQVRSRLSNNELLIVLFCFLVLKYQLF